MVHYANSAQTRDRLIAAAGPLFAAEGFAAVSTRAIATAAQENLGSIHYHFGGKEGLILETVKHAAAGWNGDPIGAYLRTHEHLYDTPAQRVALITGIVDCHVRVIFDPDRPSWHGVLMYQGLQRPGPARNYLMDHIMRPNCAHLLDVHRRITGREDPAEAFAWAVVMLAPLVFLADYRDALPQTMGWTTWPQAVFTQIRRRLLEDALRGLDLQDTPS